MPLYLHLPMYGLFQVKTQIIPWALCHYLCSFDKSHQIRYLLKILPSLCIAHNRSSNLLALQGWGDSGEVLASFFHSYLF